MQQQQQDEETGSDDEEGDSNRVTTRIQSLIRPNKQSNKMFASLLEFFTQEWQLSLKHLFDAEWGVFAALGFSLHPTPSQVAFHFKRLMKTLGWNPRVYLGDEMYDFWQEALEEEDGRRQDRERRKEQRRQEKQAQLLNLHIEIENEVLRRKHKDDSDVILDGSPKASNSSPLHKQSARRGGGIKLLHRFGMRRIVSQDKIHQMAQPLSQTYHPGTEAANRGTHRRGRSGDALLPHSPSLPSIPTVATALSADNGQHEGVFVIDIPPSIDRYHSETSSNRSVAGSDIDDEDDAAIMV
jgi:hypothetical protein